MFRIREELVYAITLLPIVVLEGCLAIPMFIPLFDSGMSQMYLVAVLAHVTCFLFLLTKMVDVRPYVFHSLGILGIFISVIPYINSLYHIAVCILGIRAIKQCIQYIKQKHTETTEEER